MKTEKERIEDIIKYYCSSKAEFARKLEESPQTISNWVKRGFGKSVMDKIITVFPEINANWLLTGEGSMLKKSYYTANYGIVGNNNVGIGNEITGDNKGVIGNTGTVGNIGCHNINVPGTAKKIMEPGKVTIEMDQSVENLLQTIESQALRIKDLERTINHMEALIELLRKE